jgi:acetyl-CoA synthetase
VSDGLAHYLKARQFLPDNREDYEAAYRGFRWPELDEFNWALEWFDRLGSDPGSADRDALRIVEPDRPARSWTFAQLSARSARVASWLRSLGARRGDRIVLMLGNQVELWEMILAAMKLGAVIIPATTLLAPDDLRDRVERGQARFAVVASPETGRWAGVPGDFTRIAVGPAADGWLAYADSEAAPAAFEPDGVTRASDPLLLYFTSGTTAKPKLVQHTRASYPVGHLPTMYWIGLEPGDVHLNISSPGWAKHAWSDVFAPWNAAATVLICNYVRFDAAEMLRQIGQHGVTSFCAPPTVWRMLIQVDLPSVGTPPRKLMGAGEPLNPEVIEQVEKAWGVRIRDGLGQTETMVLIANSPGQPVKPGSMGRPMPGYQVVLVDPATGEPGAAEGEICLDLAARRSA